MDVAFTSMFPYIVFPLVMRCGVCDVAYAMECFVYAHNVMNLVLHTSGQTRLSSYASFLKMEQNAYLADRKVGQRICILVLVCLIRIRVFRAVCAEGMMLMMLI